MITSTPSPTRNPGRARRAFTLVEVMVASTLASFVLAAVLTTFLFMGRSGTNLRNYSDMEAQARKSLETFAEDVRQASTITWTSGTEFTVLVPQNVGPSKTVRYFYTSAEGTFKRVYDGGAATTLISGITAGTFAFKAYNVAGGEMPLVTTANLTAASSSTKQLQISLEAQRQNTTVTAATNLVLSARFILRNKVVTA
jgi:prepilin-type N-terminal cleavage/methylation domain-containing protein